MSTQIVVKNFVDCPEAVPFVAEKIFNQWFISRPGETLDGLISRMRGGRKDAVPVGLIAFIDGKPAGTVSLVEKDLDEYGDLRPWLAGLLVFPEYRDRGVARALVEGLMQAARDIGEKEVFLWTELPALYEKFGWKIVESIQTDPPTVAMRWENARAA